MNRIRQLRRKNHLTLTKLAEKTGIPYSTISNVEREIVDPRYFTARCISQYFGVSTDYLMGFSDEP